MAEDINRVVGGKYNGATVGWREGLAFVGSYIPERMITQENVDSIVKIDQRDGNVARGMFWGGVMGAMVAKDIGGYIMVEINWKDGSKSLVKAAKGAYDIILASSYQSNISVRANEERKKQLELQREEQLQKFIKEKENREGKWNKLTDDEKKEIIERMRPKVAKVKKKANFPKYLFGFSLFFLITGIINLILGIYVDLVVGIVFGAVGLAIGISMLIVSLVKTKVKVIDDDIVDYILANGVPEID